jgi:hypothetical protein
MNCVEFIRGAVEQVDCAFIAEVKVLTRQEFEWKPGPGANPIGFLFWHYMRSEDDMIQGFRKKSAIWESDEWFKKLGMDPFENGHGFKQAEAAKVAALPLPELLAYSESVVESTANYLKSLDDATLDLVPNPEQPGNTVSVILRDSIAHGWRHLGEISYNKRMQVLAARGQL